MATIDYKQKIKDYMNSSEIDTLYKSMLNNLFPELAESEDDRVRKAILELVRQSSEVLDKQNQNNMIAWLEKQGQTFTKKDVDDAYLKGVCDTKQELEKQGGQKKFAIITPQVFLDTLEVKVDLKKELNDFIKQQKAWIKENSVVEYDNGDSFNHIYDLEEIAKHFFELGMQQVQKGE